MIRALEFEKQEMLKCVLEQKKENLKYKNLWEVKVRQKL